MRLGNSGFDPILHNIQDVSIAGSTVQIPVDFQSRYSSTTQTHNAVSVTANSSSLYSTWIDLNGFGSAEFTALNDADTENSVIALWSNDGTNQHGREVVVMGTARYKTGFIPKKARYLKVELYNPDTIAHTMSAWVEPIV